MLEKLQFYIDGKWVDPVTPKTIDVINPANEEPFARISLGSKADVDKAVAAARKAFETFSQTTKKSASSLLQNDHRGLSEASRRDRRGDPHRDGRADVACQSRPGTGRARPYRHHAAGPEGLPVRRCSAATNMIRYEAVRRVRPDHAVELADQPDRRQGGAGAGGGLHHDPEAVGNRAAQRRAVRAR